MEVLYIPQLDEVPTTGETAATRYRLLTRRVENGVVALEDKAVNKVRVTSAEAFRAVVPPLVEGQVRDFFLRLVVDADPAPEVTFAAPTGEDFVIENADAPALVCEPGVNVYSFTETDAGAFFVNRRFTPLAYDVELDVCGGVEVETPVRFELGGVYSGLPELVRSGHAFAGWHTAETGGVRVEDGDAVLSGVSRLYAHWEVQRDEISVAVCTTENLAFSSSGDAPWRVDTSAKRSAPASARSGEIGDNASSVLSTAVEGPGTLKFWYWVWSEANYDKLILSLDGAKVNEWSGTWDWTSYTLAVGAGTHTVAWTYRKDTSQAQGSDCARIDDVSWTPSGG